MSERTRLDLASVVRVARRYLVRVFGLLLTMDGALSLRRSWREDVRDIAHFVQFFLHYLPVTLGLFLRNLAYAICVSAVVHVVVLLLRYRAGAWRRLRENTDRVVPAAFVLAAVAVVVEVVFWESALVEPGGSYYGELRHMGIIALWVVVPVSILAIVFFTFGRLQGFARKLDRYS